ncbi:MAG: hypothetical protein QM809_03295 [Gordonia sp. (in: high G+C Gram-positive bacteria)]|uniref:hypothetical protein n=1 Tax=Gordonia sp. (in: high G+C Gram-positive bacteria) TaxID=84139 RepID=UPI0039E46B57
MLLIEQRRHARRQPIARGAGPGHLELQQQVVDPVGAGSAIQDPGQAAEFGGVECGGRQLLRAHAVDHPHVDVDAEPPGHRRRVLRPARVARIGFGGAVGDQRETLDPVEPGRCDVGGQFVERGREDPAPPLHHQIRRHLVVLGVQAQRHHRVPFGDPGAGPRSECFGGAAVDQCVAEFSSYLSGGVERGAQFFGVDLHAGDVDHRQHLEQPLPQSEEFTDLLRPDVAAGVRQQHL